MTSVMKAKKRQAPFMNDPVDINGILKTRQTAFKIQKNVPIPKKGERNLKPTSKFGKTILKMEIGDSFFVKKPLKLVWAKLNSYRARCEFRFTCRTERGGTRIWRKS